MSQIRLPGKLVAIAGVLACLAIASIGLNTFKILSDSTTVTTIANLSTVTQRTSVTFPEGSSIEGGALNRSWHGYLGVKVTIPSNSVDAFLNQPAVAGLQPYEPPYLRYGHLVPKNRAASMRRFRARCGIDSRGNGLNIVVDLDDAMRPVAYIEWTNL